MCRILQYTVKQEDEGMIVRDVIRKEFHLVAHDMARAKFETNRGICLNREPVMVNCHVCEGDLLEVKLEDRPSGKVYPAKGPLDILYEDEDLVVLNKPAGIVVHPSHGHFADTLSNYLAYHYRETGQIHEVRTIGRLDKDTTGIIMFGKSRTMCALMQRQSEQKIRQKTYLALASGVFSQTEGSIEAPISREYIDKIRRAVREDGDYALTHYRVLKQYRDYALVKVLIDTGRTHQIRVHMAHIGHPLIGDPLYGAGEERGIERAALHAFHTTFYQPYRKEQMELVAPLPEDMASLLPEPISSLL